MLASPPMVRSKGLAARPGSTSKQVGPKGFEVSESGAITMDDATRKEVLVAYQKRKQEEIQHPFLNEQIEIGLIPHVQALLLARHLRGDLDGYPPMVWR